MSRVRPGGLGRLDWVLAILGFVVLGNAEPTFILLSLGEISEAALLRGIDLRMIVSSFGKWGRMDRPWFPSLGVCGFP